MANDMTLPRAIARVVDGGDLSPAEMTDVMRAIMTGGASDAQIAGFLIGLRMKGETVDEIAAAARVMRELATPVTVDDVEHLVDIVGTGGDGAHTFNISTASTFVLAAAGGRVAKHGNRSVSSSSGSADLLEAAGVNLQLDAEQVAECIERLGVGFLFAPLHHSAMKHAIGPRKEMGVRTLFNLLGPLTNPAGAPNLLLGVFDDRWVRPLAEVLRELGARHVLVVHAEAGLDEISIDGVTHACELNDGRIECFDIRPEDFGIASAPLDSLKVDSATDSLRMIERVFAGEPGPASDIVALNAGAAIHVAGLAASLADGVARAQQVIASGEAGRRLRQLAELTQEMAR